ncbi:MAG: cytochrome-c peroxidase [Gammaproteobacteria bacterium]|jgi:cytochrome c peroxidase|nr:cytochrome-c peroxidase [Gammaproteobacteria bacterium]
MMITLNTCRIITLGMAIAAAGTSLVNAAPLGLPAVPIPADNPQSDAKIALGDRLYHEERFSADGKVSCATCHAEEKAFTDHRAVSKGHNGLLGTRNAPTVINAAYMETQFWDGREPDLEGQSKQPPINPVEGGLPDHVAFVNIFRNDASYVKTFKQVFGVDKKEITIDHFAKAIASFERTIIAGDSPFDHYQFGGDKSAMSEAAVRGLAVYVGQGRCVSCHIIEQNQALFTDNRFHNIGVGFKNIQGRVGEIAKDFLKAKNKGVDVDVTVLSDPDASELGRFAVSEDINKIGAFKTPSLRNIELTPPYMHDGSQKTLADMVNFYNNGGRVNPDDPLSPFLSGGIRPLNLSDQQKKDLVAFLKALTSPSIAAKVTSTKIID